MIFCLPQPHKVRDPILLIGAMNDMIFSQGQMEATANAYHSTAQMLSNTAHDVMLEDRWKDAADIIIELVKGGKNYKSFGSSVNFGYHNSNGNFESIKSKFFSK